MSDDIVFADATELARRIRERSLSPVEVAQAHLDRIEAVNPALNALVAFPEGVIERGPRGGSRRGAGRVLGPAPRRPIHGQGLCGHRGRAHYQRVAAV